MTRIEEIAARLKGQRIKALEEGIRDFEELLADPEFTAGTPERRAELRKMLEDQLAEFREALAREISS